MRLWSFGVGIQIPTRANVVVKHDGDETEVVVVVVIVTGDEDEVVVASDCIERKRMQLFQ